MPRRSRPTLGGSGDNSSVFSTSRRHRTRRAWRTISIGSAASVSSSSCVTWGKHFSVNNMMRKESVRRRLEEGEAGISFTEFSYQLLQAYDFWELNQRFGCTLQMGGSDQWGNITAGIDLVRRLGGSRCHGLVFPLMTTASGTKFGKTEDGTVWLDAERTSPYRFYQFWLNTDDGDVVKQLRLFTLLSRDEIDALAHEVEERPQGRAAQRRLAEDVTDRVPWPGAEGPGRAGFQRLVWRKPGRAECRGDRRDLFRRAVFGSDPRAG